MAQNTTHIKSRKHPVPSRPHTAGMAAAAALVALGLPTHAQQSTTTLQDVKVESTRDTGYTPAAPSSPKFTQPLVNTTQSISVINEQVMRDQAATTLTMVRENIHRREGTSWSDEQREQFKQPIREQFERFSSPYNYASNLWCDMVIDPLETRDTMALLLELAGRVPRHDTHFGVFRM